MGSKYLVFRNCSFPLLNGYSIYGLCLTFWTNEFLGSYSNYKFIISFSIFHRMGFWRILCSQGSFFFISYSHFFFVVLQFFIFFIFIFYLLIILWGIQQIIKSHFSLSFFKKISLVSF